MVFKIKIIKKILFLGFYIGDFILIIFLIGLMGFKTFGGFALYYTISLFATAIIFGLLKKLDSNDWKNTYRNNMFKVCIFRISFIVIYILIALILCVFFPFLNKQIGATTATIVITHLLFISKDFMGMLQFFMDELDKEARLKWRWFK